MKTSFRSRRLDSANGAGGPMRKEIARMPPSKSFSGGSKFRTGDPVRMAPGSRHPVYGELAIEGWIGTIRKFDRLTRAYQIVWSKETLARMPRSYFAGCDEDALDPGTTWIDSRDLEAIG